MVVSRLLDLPQNGTVSGADTTLFWKRREAGVLERAGNPRPIELGNGRAGIGAIK